MAKTSLLCCAASDGCPAIKGLEIARQLCAGLAAAHAKGVLHRDLKPANIMLDGRGQVMVMDFGLAAFVDQISGADVRSGTPAFMAPEQLAGKEVTEKSDIYSLGLVLYEIFTGKSAYSADNLADLIKTRNAAAAVSRPSSIVKDIDPLVERVILRCLELEPANRPASVLTVAAALPGGDPLAAALAAGETPSPQMVAAAGETEGMNPLLAVICLGLAVVGLAAAVWLLIASNAYEKMTLELPPEALSAKARDVISRLGYDPRATDHASDFVEDRDLLLYVGDHDKPRAQWAQIYAQRPTLAPLLLPDQPALHGAVGLSSGLHARHHHLGRSTTNNLRHDDDMARSTGPLDRIPCNSA